MKVLLIEDDQHTSQLLAATLSAHHYAVDTIADGAAGLEMAVRWNYDLILLDVLLPNLNGVEVCRRLRAQGCRTPVLMLTVKNTDSDVVAGLDAGADDYVAKSCTSPQLLARVRALLRRGGNALSSPILSWGLLCLNPASAQVTYQHKVIPLRPKEYHLLELFLRSPQRILSRSNIIDHLWSIEETPVEGSVTNLIKDLRRRLKSAGMDAELIETVYGLGYRLKSPPENHTIERDRQVREIKFSENSVLPYSTIHSQNIREQRGNTVIQQVTERFRESLEQRITILEVAERSLQAGDLSLHQQTIVRKEVHKLAGGLGTFGCEQASEIAQAIERLLEKASQEARFADRFSQLLEELKQALAQPLAKTKIADPSIAMR